MQLLLWALVARAEAQDEDQQKGRYVRRIEEGDLFEGMRQIFERLFAHIV